MALQFSISEFNAACKGQILQGEANKSVISRVNLDSRKLWEPSTSAFFALVTKRNNGHDYLNRAYKSGVRVFVVSQDVVLPLDATVVLVENTLEALQNVAKAHRLKYNYPVFGITGSNGKTVVKEWLYQVLHTDFKIARSPKSYNSQIGVPLSLSLLENWNDLAIIEAGISKPDEMQRLAEMILPTHGIITNLNEAHSIGFSNNANKLKEKLELFRSCKTIFYCKDQVGVAQNIESLYSDKILHSWSKSDQGTLSNVNYSYKRGSTKITGNYKGELVEVSIPFTDAASLENSTHVLLIALSLGITQAKLVGRMSRLSAVDMRLNLVHGQQGSVLISDYYNSDPSSVRIALETLVQQKCTGKKIVVLSSFEQVEASNLLYQSVLKTVLKGKVDELYLIGKEWKALARQNNIKLFAKTKDFLVQLYDLPLRNAVVLIKGAREFSFEKIANALVEKKHQTFLEVNMEALVNNLNYFKSVIPKKTKVMAMVKAFSYGSGSTEIASLLQYHGVDYLGVAYLEEGVALRKSGISLPIMVMNPSIEGFSKLLKYKLEPEIYSIEMLNEFLHEIKLDQNPEAKFKIHLKVDTGMHRLGFTPDDLEVLPVLLHRDSRIEVASVFTHLVASDNKEFDEFTAEQLNKFELAADDLEKNLGYSFLRHALNSAGILRFPEKSFDMVRLGIGLYGISSVDSIQSHLQPANRFVTHISQVKEIKKEESVGYNRAFKAEENTKVATLPVGYADGYLRQLGNGNGQVFVNGEARPVIGNVCMDMIMIDVTGLNVKTGDEIELFGNEISVSKLAKSGGTIAYEIVTHISNRVPRVYKQA